MIARAYRQILFIGKDQEHSIPQLILIQHTLQLLTSFRHTVTIVAINNEDDALRILEVMPPERSDLILSTNIPHGKLDVFVFNSLYVEACKRVNISLVGDEMRWMRQILTNGWDCGHDFAKFELIKNRGFSCCVETHHQNSHLPSSP